MHNSEVKKILITGPESTGKSTLAHQLAEWYDTLWVNEYARDYLEQLNRPYVQKDLVVIAKKQFEIQNINFELANRFLFCDTGLEVIKVWSEFKYQQCDFWILDHLDQQKFDAVFLMDVDLPWEYDEYRETPNIETRKQLLESYKEELKNTYGVYHLINGNMIERFEKMKDILHKL
ncbi:AAA family ATPase [Flammeovirga yaeyamensis]|uniref:AAA family ATPase n=1 Tax=Flammeovirga yaeyamensis TaxID=367791 RepID=A0AAX1N0B0_9BACT|nr:ATP-binding protein [Flammeovirga yaeyamensis]MBB3700144.1 NadR type nicotinamide-nucleotide adenylyltransferase [Flammeovirga yaeyamensis]NMF37226.1 ATP-binding protein [Flammeovirga yaeyamensis]QWG00915.1 AAA family ATPase [Flammeovirga yaeyamensis]